MNVNWSRVISWWVQIIFHYLTSWVSEVTHKVVTVAHMGWGQTVLVHFQFEEQAWSPCLLIQLNMR